MSDDSPGKNPLNDHWNAVNAKSLLPCCIRRCRGSYFAYSDVVLAVRSWNVVCMEPLVNPSHSPDKLALFARMRNILGRRPLGTTVGLWSLLRYFC